RHQHEHALPRDARAREGQAVSHRCRALPASGRALQRCQAGHRASRGKGRLPEETKSVGKQAVLAGRQGVPRQAQRPYNGRSITTAERTSMTDTPPKIDNAPGLKWRPRKGGWEARWRAREDLVKRGYEPKIQRLWAGVWPNKVECDWISDRCN